MNVYNQRNFTFSGMELEMESLNCHFYVKKLLHKSQCF